VLSLRAGLVSDARRWLAAMIVAGSVAAGLTGASLAAPAGVLGSGPLPTCRYDDILTAPRGYDAWSTTLVDTILEVTKDYVPPDLVPVSEAGIGGKGKVRAVAITDLAAMTAAAADAGKPIAVESAYRSYTTQESTFQYWVNLDGYDQALLYSARPGHSEHQLGLAIDFRTAGNGSPFNGDWGTTPAGIWMRQHAWEYGWVQSYPKGQLSKTCYHYEAWHFRYVGRNLAAKIHASGLTPRQYLWAHFTTAVVPSPTASPRPTTRPSATSAGSPRPSPSAGRSQEPSPSPAGASSPSPDASSGGAASASAPPSASLSPSDGAVGLPSSAGSVPSPAAATLDSTSSAAIGLVIGLAALAIVAALGLRRRRRIGP
jgi:hypothetical protein